MNRTMAVITVSQEIYRGALWDIVPAVGRLRLRDVWLAYREISLDIEWQLQEEIRMELE